MKKNDDVSKIKEQVNIVDLVSEYVDLKKSGNDYVGLCPFHQDNNPSFHVSAQKQICKCYVCGTGGDVLNFYMKYHNLSFPTAIAELGKKYNIEVTNRNVIPNITQKPEHIVLQDISNFYVSAMHSTSDGHQMIKYLNKRGINNQTIKEFHLGYSFDESNNLYEFLDSKIRSEQKYSVININNLNQFNQNNRDLFAKRITIPIYDKQQIIGFGGRDLGGNVKYLNSRDSNIFHKKSVLYNFDNCIYYHNNNSIFVVEGYFDVIRAHQEGIKNVVGLMGTAFSTEHIKKLKQNNISTIYLALDSDNAGVNATLELGKTLNNDFQVRVITFTDVKDIDEFFNIHELTDFHNLTHNAQAFKLYEMEKRISNMKSSSIDERQLVIDDIFQNLQSENELVIEEVFNKLMSNFGLSREYLTEKLKKNQRTQSPVILEPEPDSTQFIDASINVILPELMTTTAHLAKRGTINKQRYLKIRDLLSVQNKKLDVFQGFFEDLGTYYLNNDKFDVIAFTTSYNNHNQVLNLFSSCEINETPEEDEVLVRSITVNKWKNIL